MEEWTKVALLLCVFGVLKEVRPLEPYITEFFLSPPMNFTHDQLNLEIYPVSVYSNLFCLMIIFLITDLVLYKPIIVLNSLCGIVLYILLLVCRSEFSMKVVQALYGLYIACEVAYYSYIYAKVEKVHFQEVTGYTRAAYLFGRAVSGILSQALMSFGVPLMTTAEITLGILVISLFWSLCLPSVSTSLYFNKNSPDEEGPVNDKTPNESHIKKGFLLLYEEFILAFTNPSIYKYILWWVFTNGGYLQVLQFVQVLWDEISSETNNRFVYNGFVEAVCTLLGAFGAYSFGKWKANWNVYGELLMSLGAAALGGVLVWMSVTRSTRNAYITYILFCALFNANVTIVKSQIACHIKPESVGLVFGVTLFLALLVQTCIMFILVQCFKLTAALQFSMYGYYFLIMGGLYGVKWIYTMCTTRRS